MSSSMSELTEVAGPGALKDARTVVRAALAATPRELAEKLGVVSQRQSVGRSGRKEPTHLGLRGVL